MVAYAHPQSVGPGRLGPGWMTTWALDFRVAPSRCEQKTLGWGRVKRAIHPEGSSRRLANCHSLRAIDSKCVAAYGNQLVSFFPGRVTGPFLILGKLGFLFWNLRDASR